MDNYPYSLSWPEPTRVKMTIVKRFLQVAALPASRAGAVLSRLRTAFPQAVAAPSILATGLTNMNATLHVANMVGNTGRLESGGNGYRFYAEGYTPSLVTLLEALDAERLAVARTFGVAVPGVATPVIDGLVALTSAMLSRDFRAEGRNLERLGLAGTSVANVKRILEHGPEGIA